MILNEFRKKLINTINESNLSIDCVYFVLKDVLSNVTELYNNQLEQEKIEKETTIVEESKKEEKKEKK